MPLEGLSLEHLELHYKSNGFTRAERDTMKVMFEHAQEIVA